MLIPPCYPTVNLSSSYPENMNKLLTNCGKDFKLKGKIIEIASKRRNEKCKLRKFQFALKGVYVVRIGRGLYKSAKHGLNNT
jgi:hypothetical protein